MLFELGIQNFVCGFILGWQSGMYRLCDLDLISRIIVLGAYSIYYLREESQNLLYGYMFGYLCVTFHFKVTVILTYDLVSRIIVSGAYLLYYLL